jgi:rubrerythrin
MDEKTKKSLAEGLMQAIETERFGQHFYRMAAGSVEDEKGREVFTTLAEEEESHEAFLKAHYRSLLEKGELDAGASLGVKADLSGDNPIFSDKVRARAGTAHAEMTALGIGVQIELSSVLFYKDLAQRAPSKEARDFFQALADWESAHYHALLRQQEALKEDYWSAGGFAPF